VKYRTISLFLEKRNNYLLYNNGNVGLFTHEYNMLFSLVKIASMCRIICIISSKLMLTVSKNVSFVDQKESITW